MRTRATQTNQPEGPDSHAAADKLDLKRAWQALRKLVADPDDTAQVFTLIDALSGRAKLRMLARFRSDAGGRRLLAERPEILGLLRDRAALERMPRGSLAHAYLSFLDREGITADGLVEASVAGSTSSEQRGSELDYVRARMRDTHDLWHTVTGYQGDLVGEVALLAFNVAQLSNPALAVIVLTALVRSRSIEFAKLAGHAFREGQRAQWLPGVHWEALLPLPLEQVRSELGIAPAPAYAPLRTTDVVALGYAA